MTLSYRRFAMANAGVVLTAVSVLGGRAKADNAQPPPVTIDVSGRHAFAVVNVPHITWQESEQAARQSTYQGVAGHLAVIHDASENELVTRTMLLNGGKYAWIGGCQDHQSPDYREPDGGWRWVTGEPIRYTHWFTGEPNNAPYESIHEDHLLLREDGTWNDAEEPCGTYIIEYDLPASGEPAGQKPAPAVNPANAADTGASSPADPAAALRLLARVRQKLLSYRTYEETVTIRLLDADGVEQDSARGELTWEKPNRFRLVGTTEGGKITAVGDGRQFFLMDRSEPDTYVLRSAPPFPDALTESLLAMSGYNVPTVVGLLADEGGSDAPSAKSVPWVATARVLETYDGDEPRRTLVADLTFPFDAVPKMKATYKIIVGARDDTLREEQLHFTYQDKAVTLSIVHSERAANPTLRPDAFVFHVPENAERVRHLKDGVEN